jgi:hypothetical protein
LISYFVNSSIYVLVSSYLLVVNILINNDLCM